MYLNEVNGLGPSIENPLLCVPVELYEIGFNNKCIVQSDRIVDFVEINANSKRNPTLNGGVNSN